MDQPAVAPGRFRTPPAVVRRNLRLLLLSIGATVVLLRLWLHLSPDADFNVGSYNIHHLFTGLLFITAGGIPLALFRGSTPRLDLCLVIFGIGLGMALDEWVYLIATDGSNASYLLPVSFWGAVVVVGAACLYAFFLSRARRFKTFLKSDHNSPRGRRMKAIVYERYGSPDVLELKEIAKPVPKENEVLIRTYATTVTSGDWRARSLQMPRGFGFLGRLVFGISRPRQPVLGTELAGEIEAVGKDVKKFRVGDQVFAFGDAGMGCYAEYKCMSEDGAVALKPSNLSYDEAAALSFGGTTALNFFRRAKIQRGEKVLINGASGGVGTAAVQLARHFGADVTGVCSAANAEMVRSLGANCVIDYTREDFAANGERYDIIVDTAGTAPFSRSKGSLTDNGRLLLVLGSLPDLLQAPWVSMTNSKKVIAGPATGKAEDLRFLAELAEAGEFRPVIDRRYPFEQIAAAHGYVDTGRKKGNVIITLGHDD